MKIMQNMASEIIEIFDGIELSPEYYHFGSNYFDRPRAHWYKANVSVSVATSKISDSPD